MSDYTTNMKRAVFQPSERPYGWIQWKGTDVCMDVRCKCGRTGHVDADFAYHVKCSSCKTVYFVNPHIEFIELTPEEGQNAQCVVDSVVHDD